mmetsp:Transcript_9165/g.11753  ORF Transcript_9165/g.11753 Transcript_9165/m.11753 type:complete len:97 (-) Transcript_9165:590-880(-)|eukprot:CAMPEP_0185765956 /NCGR_PEP_ID=MMETSP1174-20130828/33880_1 /TAXON_ID=35687 /ORGANISM="Dictyocha speculum, Strain CCMP1381" /LENGTH=96 /DNA_ID=CAMNT_0028449399 /DNA_START=59 /DNA_END=349 /DNA_ORIENTATION=-
MATQAKAANQLETVTDFVEDKALDSAGTQQALESLQLQQKKADSADEDLDMSISIAAEDVSLIVQELEVPKIDAEKALRRNNGNVVEALRSLITCP